MCINANKWIALQLSKGLSTGIIVGFLCKIYHPLGVSMAFIIGIGSLLQRKSFSDIESKIDESIFMSWYLIGISTLYFSHIITLKVF
jgi:hypothetical protein